jgi:hypothetical protein
MIDEWLLFQGFNSSSLGFSNLYYEEKSGWGAPLMRYAGATASRRWRISSWSFEGALSMTKFYFASICKACFASI